MSATKNVTVVEGCKVDSFEINMHDDSDFYAEVVTPAGEIKSVCIGSTRCGGWETEFTMTSIPPEVAAKAIEAATAKIATGVRSAAVAKSEAFKIGCKVQFTNGMKKPTKNRDGTEAIAKAGDTGTVIYAQPSRYSRFKTRIGVKLDKGGVVFTESEVTVIPSPIDETEVQQAIDHAVQVSRIIAKIKAKTKGAN